MLATMAADVGKRYPSLVAGRTGTTFFFFPAWTSTVPIRYGTQLLAILQSGIMDLIPANDDSGRTFHWPVEQTMECLN